jgi:uncharacterized protein YrrD
MLVANTRLIGTKVLSVQTGAPIGQIVKPIVDPSTFKIIAFELAGPLIREANYLTTDSIREYSHFGMVADSIDELVSPSDVVRLEEVLSLNFSLTGLKVETKKGSKLGHILDFTISSDDYMVAQIIVKRPLIKSFNDSTLVISRKEIVEVTDYKIIVKDEESTLKSRAAKEDFIPNFVNPFRNSELSPSPAHTETPGDKDN